MSSKLAFLEATSIVVGAEDMATGVLFDLFGTLVIPRPGATIVGRVSESLAHSFQHLGIDLSNVDVETLEIDVWDVEPLAKEADATPFERRLAAFAYHRLGVRRAAADFRAAADDACDVFQAARMVDPTAADVLKKLSEFYVIGLVTNYDHPPHIHSVMATTVLGSVMQDVVISGEVELWKPDPAILHLACKRLHLVETETIYVGDSIVDYQAASTAGLRFAWIHRTDRNDREDEAETRDHFAESDAMLHALADAGDISLVDHLEELIDRLSGGPY